MKKTGHIQKIFISDKAPQLDIRTMKTKTAAIAKERYEVTSFKGRLSLLKAMLSVYRSGCTKAYVFFDKIEIK